MESAKNVRWIIPFKKFGMIRVKDINTKFGILAHHDKVQFQDKGHNFERTLKAWAPDRLAIIFDFQQAFLKL